MDTTVCDLLKNMLTRLDRISNVNTCLMAVRDPPRGIGINIFHIYIAPSTQTIGDREITLHYMYVQKLGNPRSRYFTCPNERIEWEAGIQAPALSSDTVWIDLAQGDESFRYDSYAALHILQELKPPSLPGYTNMEWQAVRVLRPLAEQNSPQIGCTIGKFLNQKIFPFMLNNPPYNKLLE
jgi:hypothetical protein